MGLGHSHWPLDELSMRIKIDYDLCEGNARCMDQAPTVFKVDDEDNLHVLIEEPGEELREAVDNAAAICPRQAITIVDD